MTWIKISCQPSQALLRPSASATRSLWRRTVQLPVQLPTGHCGHRTSGETKKCMHTHAHTQSLIIEHLINILCVVSYFLCWTWWIPQDPELTGRGPKGQNCLMGCCNSNLEEPNGCQSQVSKAVLRNIQLELRVLTLKMTESICLCLNKLSHK